MIGLDVKTKESLERDNLLHCEAIVVASLQWLQVLARSLLVALSTRL
jgi:hypothetical protein